MASELEYQPALGDRLHPRSGVGDDLPNEVLAVVRNNESGKRAAGNPARGAHDSPKIFSSRVANSAALFWSAVESASRREESQTVFLRRMDCSSLRP